jgi:biopolymer transport protein ExbD
MRLAKNRRGNKMEINLTPMIDVTFLLLIFFMTVNQVSKAESERVEPPRLAGSQDQSDEPFVIEIDAAGEINAAGRAVAPAGVVPLVAAKIKEAGQDPARVNIVLRADRRGDCRIVNKIVNALDKLQINRVRIAVQSGDK